ncbi:MAG TPA: MSMEG_4193 family putative phosphomutase [Streptosporangiaceae bacterium]
MSTVLLVRHGLTAKTGPVLTGRTPGVHLDDRGTAQAAELAKRLAPVPLTACVSSPLERCQETAAAIAAGRDGLGVRTEERLIECGYGDWTGQRLEKLAKEPLWRVVQNHPSAAVFPGTDGEALADVQRRAVAAVRHWNAVLGPDATYVACSHGDVIKAVVADALGLHLDQFQRIQIDPCSLTVIRYSELRPFVVRVNDPGDVTGLVPKPKAAPPRRKGLRGLFARPRTASGADGGSDAPVGGGSG